MKQARQEKKTVVQFFEMYFCTSWRPYFWLCLIGFIVYIQTLWYTFSPMDDFWLVEQRLDFLKDIANFPLLFSEELTTVGYSAFYYRPVLNMSFMFDAIIGGDNPVIFHLGNIIIHLLNVMLLFKIFNKLNINRQLSFVLARESGGGK